MVSSLLLCLSRPSPSVVQLLLSVESYQFLLTESSGEIEKVVVSFVNFDR